MKTIIRHLLLFVSIPAMALGAATDDEATLQKMNREALRCLANIRSDLAALGKKHPAFKGIENNPIRPSDEPKSYVECEFRFGNATKEVLYPPFNPALTNACQVSVIAYEPEDNAVFFQIMIQDEDRMRKAVLERVYIIKLGDRDINAYYNFMSGKDVEKSETPARTIIEKRLKAFCNAWHGQEVPQSLLR